MPDTEVWATNLDRSKNKGKAVTMKDTVRDGRCLSLFLGVCNMPARQCNHG